MRPIRITGVTGTTVPVPLDVYTIGPQTAVRVTGGTLQTTVDNVFDLDITPVWEAAPPAIAGIHYIPAGIRAVRATGMTPSSVLVVSQQGIR